MNTLILDLTLSTIQYQNLPLILFQTALICSIYLVLKLYYNSDMIDRAEHKTYPKVRIQT